jgi:copper(I)-binding protein
MFNHSRYGHLSRKLVLLLGLSALCTAALAHEFKVGDIQIIHPNARPTVAQQTSGAAYFGLNNTGKTDDRLIKVESSVAKSVEMHNMEMSGDVMKMREVEGIDLKAGSQLEMKRGGGYHIMLNGLNQALKAGDRFPMTLIFAKAGKVDVVVYVEAEGK